MSRLPNLVDNEVLTEEIFDAFSRAAGERATWKEFVAAENNEKQVEAWRAASRRATAVLCGWIRPKSVSV